MNSPIKFRAWDKSKAKMATVWDIGWKAWDSGDELNYVRVECGDGTYDLLENEVELMQFTGLLDKNGKEIYEGDILQARDKWADPKVLLTVVFQAGAYWSNGRKHAMPLWDIHPYAEVIGNIYENRELLNES